MYKRYLRQLFTAALALSLSATSVFAGNAIISSNTEQEVKLQAIVDESWEVTIPKEVNLTSENRGSGLYTGSIPVTVKGDIGVTRQIIVETDETLVLTDSSGLNTESVNAEVTVNKTEFTSNEIRTSNGASTEHTISAELTPGTWEGTQEFRINIKEKVSFNLNNIAYNADKGQTFAGWIAENPESKLILADPSEPDSAILLQGNIIVNSNYIDVKASDLITNSNYFVTFDFELGAYLKNYSFSNMFDGTYNGVEGLTFAEWLKTPLAPIISIGDSAVYKLRDENGMDDGYFNSADDVILREGYSIVIEDF